MSGSSSFGTQRSTNNVGAIVSKVVRIASLENSCLRNADSAAKYVSKDFQKDVKDIIDNSTTQTGPWADNTDLNRLVEKLAGYITSDSRIQSSSVIQDLFVLSFDFRIRYGAMLPSRWEYSYFQKFSMRVKFEATSTASTAESKKAISATVAFNSKDSGDVKTKTQKCSSSQ